MSAQAVDRVQLTIPAEEDFHHVAHLVVGGLGVRLDLTFEDLDDVQVALEALDRGESPLGLRRVLETVTDSFEIEERDGGSWVELTKHTSSGAGAPA